MQSFHRSRLSLPGAAMLLATTLVLSQQISHAQQPQARRVGDAVLRIAGTTGDEWLTYGTGSWVRSVTARSRRSTRPTSRGSGRPGRSTSPAGTATRPAAATRKRRSLVSNGVLYGITTWSVVYAVDARTGKQLWKWDPEVNRPAVQTKICCGVVSRGVALYEGKVIAPIIDGRLVALDAASGKPVWEARVEYPQNQYTLTMAPRIAKGKVIVGASGAEYPVRGFVDAFDANTGQRAWRFYTVPGDPKKPFENEAMRKAAPTWSGEWYKMGGGGTVWDGMAYDPQANLVYFGTGNGGPWPEVLRGSQGKDNLYVCSIIAVNADTGEMKWYYQAVPGDSWDYDAVAAADARRHHDRRAPRQVIMQANKNGYFYVIDRHHGRVHLGVAVRADELVGSDGQEDGPAVHSSACVLRHRSGDDLPGPIGAHNWAPMSFNPQTGLMYIPTTFANSITYTVNPKTFEFKEGGRNTGIGRGNVPEPPAGADAHPGYDAGGHTGGALRAADDRAAGRLQRRGFCSPGIRPRRRKRWRKEGGGASGGGTLTTAGNLVLQVLPDGRLIVYSADKGDKLHEIQHGSASRDGTADHLHAGRQAVRRVDRWSRHGSARLPRPRAELAHAAAPATPPADAGAPQPPRLVVFALDGK